MTPINRDIPAKVLPYTIVVDTNEQAPYTFTGIHVDSDRYDRHWVVNTTTKPLYLTDRKTITLRKGRGEYLKGLADYSIEGFESRVQIERKSRGDLYGTLGQRRREFEAEIKRLCECDYAAVVVEAELSDMFQNPPPEMPVKNIARTIMSWSIEYPQVHWFLMPGRRAGELCAFQLLHKWWNAQQGKGAVTHMCRSCLLEFSLPVNEVAVCTGCGAKQEGGK